ncbi:hypothetical protein EON66_11420 [archaeon]|nr:MAG: hypothetical protein EON66_11420 [archaeon]
MSTTDATRRDDYVSQPISSVRDPIDVSFPCTGVSSVHAATHNSAVRAVEGKEAYDETYYEAKHEE